MGGFLTRLALRLVPRSWRDAIARDLEEEAGADGRGSLWRSWHAARAGLRLRPVLGYDAVAADLRYAVRSLLRARWFAVGASLTFALGIGINVAVFSAVDRMLFRPLPYGNAGELAVPGRYVRDDARPSGTLSAPAVFEVRRQVASIVGLATTGDTAGFAAAPDAARDLSLIRTSWNVLRVLEVAPALGRDFTEDDVRTGRVVALLKHEVWQARFGGSADVIGKSLWDGVNRAEIVGVLPAGFIQPPTLFDPRSDGVVLSLSAFDAPAPKAREAPPTVRIRRGMTFAAVELQLAALTARLRQDGTLSATGTSEYRLMSMRDAMFGRYATYLWLVSGAAALVLMMCCVNLASLLLVRGRAREQVVAMHLALGASPARLVATAFVECLLLSVAGAAIAFATVGIARETLLSLLPPTFTRHAESLTDTRVLLVSILGATLCAVVAGLAPSVRSVRVDVLPALQRGAGRGGSMKVRGGASLLVVEAAVAVVLVSGAAMTARSLIGLLRTDLGFDAKGLHYVRVFFPPPPNQDAALQLQRYLGARDALRGLVGVRMVAGADVLPIIGAASMTRFGPDRRGRLWQVTDGFFETMGMRVLAGRTIGPTDLQAGAGVAVLSESGATLVWPGRPAVEAVGQTVAFPDEPSRHVIGVVSDVRGSFGDTTSPSMYVPVTSTGFRFLMFAIRTGPTGSVPITEVQHRVQPLGADSNVIVNPISARLASGLLDQRFRTVLFGTFGVIALVLAAVGLYAMTAFDVARRTAEMGVRLSLGALPGDVMRLVLLKAIRPVAAGVAIGLVAAWWAATFLQAFLHQIDARDPWTLAAVVAVLLVTALAAAWLPAHRASRIDPAEVLRTQ